MKKILPQYRADKSFDQPNTKEYTGALHDAVIKNRKVIQAKMGDKGMKSLDDKFSLIDSKIATDLGATCLAPGGEARDVYNLGTGYNPDVRPRPF